MKTIVVSVTAEDIAAALAMGGGVDGGTCPIARALRRTWLPDAWVTRERVRMYLHDLPGEPLTAKAKAFVRAFDTEKPVQPTTFRLRVPA